MVARGRRQRSAWWHALVLDTGVRTRGFAAIIISLRARSEPPLGASVSLHFRLASVSLHFRSLRPHYTFVRFVTLSSNMCTLLKPNTFDCYCTGNVRRWDDPPSPRCRASFDARPTFAPCSWSPQGRDCPAQRESSVYSSGNQTDRQSLLLLLLCFFLLLSPLDLLASMVALHMLLLTTPPCVHR